MLASDTSVRRYPASNVSCTLSATRHAACHCAMITCLVFPSIRCTCVHTHCGSLPGNQARCPQRTIKCSDRIQQKNWECITKKVLLTFENNKDIAGRHCQQKASRWCTWTQPLPLPALIGSGEPRARFSKASMNCFTGDLFCRWDLPS